MPQDGVHTFVGSAWHYCGRCERRMKLDSEARWQNSILLCDDCYDSYPVLLGDIERQQALAVSMIDQAPDLRPNEKLVNPTLEMNELDILL